MKVVNKQDDSESFRFQNARVNIWKYLRFS